jgi:hypothetical protein
MANRRKWISILLNEVVVREGSDSEFEIVVDLSRQAFKVESGMAKKNSKAILGSIPPEQKNELQAILLQLSETSPFHLANPRIAPYSKPIKEADRKFRLERKI